MPFALNLGTEGLQGFLSLYELSRDTLRHAGDCHQVVGGPYDVTRQIEHVSPNIGARGNSGCAVHSNQAHFGLPCSRRRDSCCARLMHDPVG